MKRVFSKRTGSWAAGLLASLFLLPPSGWSQDHQPPPPHEMGRQGKGPKSQNRKDHRQHVETWLAHLESANPGEYERLVQLRENSPAAFRTELWERMHRERIQARIKEMPQLQQLLMKLPPEERAKVLTQFSQLQQKSLRDNRRRDQAEQELVNQEKRTHELASAYRNSSGEERIKIEQALRSTLEAHFDFREIVRTKQLATMKEKLGKLEAELSDHKERKETIIENRLRELIGPR